MLAPLDPAPLRRPAAVVRDGRHVLDRRDLEPRRLQRANRRFPSTARAPHPHLDALHPLPQRLARARLGRHLRGERRALARTLEADLARARPSDDVAVEVGDRDDRVVEARLHVGDAIRAHLAVALLCFLDLSHSRSLRPGPKWPAWLGARLARRRLGRRDRLLHHARRLLRAFSRPCVRPRALAAHRESPPVPQAAVGADIHQALHVHRHLAAQRALHLVLAVDDAAQAAGVLVAQALDPHVGAHAGGGEDALRRAAADAIDVGERDFDALLGRQIDTRNACHGSPYFWRCLCLGLRLQITRITPLRRTILQCSQIFFTDERTFMGRLLYLYRYTIRPRLRSYGESSTVTLSPGRILMKCIRILPEMWASTLWPFSSSTRNIAFGSGSTTVPSTWMPSSFATAVMPSNPLSRAPKGSRAPP